MSHTFHSFNLFNCTNCKCCQGGRIQAADKRKCINTTAVYISLDTNLTSLLMNWLGPYARVVDHLAVKNFAQGAPLEGGLYRNPP
jgi:hypothetical protein